MGPVSTPDCLMCGRDIDYPAHVCDECFNALPNNVAAGRTQVAGVIHEPEDTPT